MEEEFMDKPHLVDRTGTRYPLTDPRWRGDDGGPLAVSELPGLRPDQVDAGERSLWRYAAALPVPAKHRVSLGEGWTPLLPLDWAGARVLVKPEWFNPTSSFKDRGVSVMVSHLRRLGATRILEDSSGNGGSSVAAYAAAAGIGAKIIVPEATSAAKILMSQAFGAEIELVAGTRDEVGAEAMRQSATIPYASHNWHPLFLQGVKTLGFEIWEQLGFEAPDNVVVVAGAGSQVLGLDLAFTELLAAGSIQRRPRIFVGQPAEWATIVEGVASTGSANAATGSANGRRTPTIAEGASIANPVRLPEAVDAVRRSGGGAYAVPEAEILAAVRKICSRGLYAEPTSAVAVAALDHFLTTEEIAHDQRTVLVLSGTGLKSAEKMATILGNPDE
ncbi:pyridoxal-phosphate dependent enzyme [Naumannella sp. ID2617S]|nr:pyridoxal-phosphate dependent enzyme [Naumannella sp. ID2617S]